MATYKLADGIVLTDLDIEEMAREWEEGTWEGPWVELRVGRPRLSEEPNANLSFKCPESSAALSAAAAKELGVKKSAFMREAAVETAVRVLAAAG